MPVKLIRQMLAPLRRWAADPDYRQWIKLSDRLRSITPETVASVKVSGFNVHFSDAQALLNMYENIFLNRCYAFPSDCANPVIIDCGANIGLSVLWLAKHYPQASITAFEPDPLLFGLLQRNIIENNITADLKNEAVWNDDTSLRFAASCKQDARISETGNIQVKAVRLKNILQSMPQVDFLKLDIEGAEYEVLHDCKDELHRIRNLFVECHFEAGSFNRMIEVLQLLHHARFRCSLLTPVISNPLGKTGSFQTMDVFAVSQTG